ncbi:MAG: periplasmic heavy metal sensor [Proteobacteria bacterium]|nr:periplasmic heavy metal sensor [Pseudomonadota bacterium]MBU4209576.1 periplasmic heavy metal sensor [Pseudomonadota bacterium]MBU4503691.1 periplasmic heavy metal sensor [Pseudomonadota bacterium]
MKPNYLNNFVIVLTIVAILGFGTNAFARQGAGYCRNVCLNQCAGQKDNCGMNKLSEEQIKAINEQRKAFFDATEDLRQKIYEKETELTSVLAKKEPDAEKAKAVQKDISDLKSQLHQKKIDHIVKMKKINPYCDRKACGLMDRDRDRDRGCCR